MSSQGKNVVAVIPARGGSKRIPRKNIREFHGRPIIAYSIDAAQRTELFSAVYVSTEDKEISQVSKDLGASVINRSDELADDYTPTIPVVRHAIKEIESLNNQVNAVCCIYPTNPLLCSEDIVNGYQRLVAGSWDFVFSASEFVHSVQRCFMLDKEQSVNMYSPENYSIRTQDLEKTYFDADKFYWGTVAAWQDHDSVFNSKASAIIIPTDRVTVLDNEIDWERAEEQYQTFSAKKRSEYYLGIIEKIEKIRNKNNTNWMDVLRLAFRHAPDEAAELMVEINKSDNAISNLVNTMTKSPDSSQ